MKVKDLNKFILLCFVVVAFTSMVQAADVINNGNFSGGTTGWTHVNLLLNTTTTTDGTVGNPAPSLKSQTDLGDAETFEFYNYQTITQTINSTDVVRLTAWVSCIAQSNATAAAYTHEVRIKKPSGATVTIWQFSGSFASADVQYSSSVTDSLVSAAFDENGTYEIQLYSNMTVGNINPKRDPLVDAIAYWDNIVLDVVGAANQAPTVVAGATTPSPATVNRVGANTTTISTDFTDADQPGVGAFTVTFKVKDNTEAETILVNAQTNGNGGLTITDNGGGSYTASYTWDPGAGQTVGPYDLYFEVSDGTDNAIDAYVNNTDELTVISQNAPTVVAGATTPAPATVNRVGANTTTISTDFTDADQPGVGAFTVTFKVKDNLEAETILVNNLANGVGGLTITDNGGGSYTASYTWDPGAGQTVGPYDLYFEVSDGIDNAIDAYASNTDELTITSQTAPTVTAGATTVSPATVNRLGANTTTISTDFTDVDQPGVGAFTCTFKIKSPTEVELILVNNQSNGGGGLTITDNGGGSYTASYTYNPADAQELGTYDLYFEVSDGIDNAIDNYVDNAEELTINEPAPNNAPTVVAGATAVAPSSINKIGTNTTTISTDFTDTDQQAVGSFTITFKVKDNGEAETILVNALTNGSGGLTVTDNGGGSYTASYTWDPGDAQNTGPYDLYFEVNDGVDNAIDAYVDNTDELTITQQYAPTVVAGATTASPASVNRVGANITTISTDFTDLDQPGVGAFTVTFKVKDNVEAETVLVNNLGNGVGGLTITDNGGGSYTASYDWNPSAIQTLGAYDLYFEVSDGIDNGIDDYLANTDELTIIESNDPTVVAGATSVSPASVNIVGTNTATISTDFTDIDQPGVGAFTVTFKVKDNTEAETVLVNNLGNGVGGLTITDNGGGSYTASYSWDPGLAQTLGAYDLYFEVYDGGGTAIDNYIDNTDELTLTQQYVPTVAASATTASPASVNRVGANTTTISTDFTDLDQPGVGAFTVIFKVKDNVEAETILVNNLGNGVGGLTITDNGGGSYTASYDWNPSAVQNLGAYDLYFEVSDGIDNAIDDYTANTDELTITESNDPTIVADTTQVNPTTVNRYGANTTVISAVFTDLDQPGINAFNCTFKIKSPTEAELILINNLPHGTGGLTITDLGGGDYRADYTYNPADNQELGLYDLYFEVTDGGTPASDGYAANTDELTIEEVIPPLAPTVVAGATTVSVNPVNRLDNNTTVISTVFSDQNQPGENSFNVTFKIKDIDEVEYILVNNQANGAGGLTIVSLGGDDYQASYTWDPPVDQKLGTYDLYFEVDDNTATANAIDNYTSNLDQLTVNEVVSNSAPSFTAGATSVNPISVDRGGAATTTFSIDFTDTDIPGAGTFYVSFYARRPFNQGIDTIAYQLQNGVSGMTITDGGGGSYTASISWNPPDNSLLGFYDLSCEVFDGIATAYDNFSNNTAELQLTSGSDNIPPVIPTSNTVASPMAIERIGANPTTISTQFSDGDSPAVTAFTVTFKVKDNAEAETVLANNVGHGTGGVTITDHGGGVYTAAINWDPVDAEVLGLYDLYFHVTDGIDTAFDGYTNNTDELELYDAVSNNAPLVTAGNTTVIPSSITRNGSEQTIFRTTFSDANDPGVGGFNISYRIFDGVNDYWLITNAVHGDPGVRIRNLGSGSYEASYVYDPAVSVVASTYDVYFEVVDNGGLSASDPLASNANELTITNDPVLGDGRLLRRTHNNDNCGSPTTACHNVADHQTQGCLTCHTPHGTKNIYMIRETITTPSSGDKTVIFKATGKGDPYNDPSSLIVPGDPNSGVMADSTDNVFTGICEVCHVDPVGHHRNDGSQPGPNHNDAEICTGCHPHSEGFGVSGGGESSGGSGCTCHSFRTGMAGSGTYHHHILSENADYTISSKTCLMCHVNHDIFRPDLNTGFGQRAKNLRVDITTSVVQGSSTVLANYDYTSSGTGGICLSCHTSTQTKSSNPPDGTTSTRSISKSEFDASNAHNYIVTSSFSDASTFNGNCVKCHNDNKSKSYQSGNKFGTHDSNKGRFLDTLGQASLTDPLEENNCYGCHSGSSGSDYYGVATMTTTSQGIKTAFTRTYTHPTETYSGRHNAAGEDHTDLADGNRHAECVDCHSVHGAQKGTHDGSSNLVSGALKQVWGVDISGGVWPAAPTTMTDNANTYVTPAFEDFVVVNPATKEYQICLKCHSNYTTLPSGNRNLAAEINPNYPSTHAIVQAGDNPFCDATTMNEPWATSKINYCSDCHSSDQAGDPKGPHGSNSDHLLVATIVSSNADNDTTGGTPLCHVCHKSSVYWLSSGAGTPSDYDDHPATQGAHQLAPGCFSCHMWDHTSTSGSGEINTTDWPGGYGSSTPSAPDIPVFVHGQNKIWNYYTYQGLDAVTATKQPVENFINGFIANMDHGANRCWAETCKNHANKAY